MNEKTNEERIRELEEQVRKLQGQPPLTVKEALSSKNLGSKKVGFIIFWVILLVAASLSYWGFSTGLKGYFSFQGLRYEAKSCRSGAAFVPQFWGFVVRNKGKEGARFEVQGNSPDTAQIFVWIDAKTTPHYNRQNCKKLELNFEENNAKVNDVLAMRGFLKAECKNEMGQEFIADVQFRNCH